MSIETIAIIVIVGGIAGWLAGVMLQGSGFGILIDIVVGVIGGFVGTWVLGRLGATMPGSAFVAAVLTAFVGASILVVFVIVLRRAFSPRRRL